MRRAASLTLAFVLAASLAATVRGSAQADEPGLRAGVGIVDLSWHVGRNQGQLGSAGNMLTGDRFDPYVHTTTQVPTEGIQARLTARALVVEDAEGNRVAYLKTDHYLQQDLLFRRVAQLLASAEVGIDAGNLMAGATHNHSAPYGATTSWGVWLFADALDVREFDYFARGMADAVLEAVDNLRPVRMGASVGQLTEVQQNILGPAVADDGTPAGFPRDHFDPELAVVRFDDVSDPAGPRPYAMLVNLGMHPESLANNGMLSPDFVGQVELYAERLTGATVIWSQGGLGDSEPDREARANPPELRREYWRRDFRQADEMSRLIADRVAETFGDVEVGASAKHVPFSRDVEVGMTTMRFPGPASHPVPTVSNCRTEAAAGGRPGVPVAGLPDCSRQDGPDVRPIYDLAKDLGVPIVENYGSVPGYGGAQETLHAHLQVMRLGDVVLAACPCEPITDMTLNFKTRTESGAPDPHLGYLWDCDVDAETCDFRTASWRPEDRRPVAGEKIEKMYAQVLNPADGWDDETPEAIVAAEAESTDPTQIRGNFTHESIGNLDCGGAACAGYKIPLMVGTANDYIGYIVTYREYQRGDHYRKALTAFGPHTADYINTRLVRMAATLQGADDLERELLQETVTAEDTYLHARALALGEAAAAARTAYEAGLPDDGDDPRVLVEPADLERFDGAQVRWVGGSHYTDNPRVTVERLEGDWGPVASQDGGEVVVTMAYERAQDLGSWTTWASGQHVTVWTATFEVFEQTEPGTYRFRVEGDHRRNRAPQPYTLTSDPFDVEVWTGVDAFGAALDADTLSFEARAVYPVTYEPVGVGYISPNTTTVSQSGQTYCFRCTFRAWAAEGEVVSAAVTVDGIRQEATLSEGRWVLAGVGPGATVVIAPGDLVDEHGNVNGSQILIL